MIDDSGHEPPLGPGKEAKDPLARILASRQILDMQNAIS
jgi:hypothetical protein